jgi:hypothetical protein
MKKDLKKVVFFFLFSFKELEEEKEDICKQKMLISIQIDF